MLIIGDVIVSEVLLERAFVCNLSACKGACCVEGDEGAPVEEDELGALERNYQKVKPYLTQEGIEQIEQNGKTAQRKQGYRTTLRKDGACAYVNFDEQGVAYCGIEKAWQEGNSDFRKPISCHLYPARTKQLDGAEALNYEEWEICDPACKLGDELQVPVFKFLKDALIRRYGVEFYEALEAYAQQMES